MSPNLTSTINISAGLNHGFTMFTQIFLVRRDRGQSLMVVSVRLPDQQGVPQILDLHVKEERGSELTCTFFFEFSESI